VSTYCMYEYIYKYVRENTLVFVVDCTRNKDKDTELEQKLPNLHQYCHSF
jgi:hypothetical protein